MVLDAGLRVTFYNARQADQWSRAGLERSALDLIGAPVSRVYPLLDEGGWGAVRQDVIEGRVAIRRGLASANGKVVVDVSVPRLDAADGSLAGADCVSDEVMPSREREERDEHERLAAVGRTLLAQEQDLRAPRVTILGTAEVLLEGGLDAQARARLDTIKAAALRVADALRMLTGAGRPRPENHT